MIVDDNPANLDLLSDMLLRQGYDVRSFPLGRLALASAVKNPPDLILLDVNMPEMKGYEVCERLKSLKEFSQIPVIFLSALNETEDKVKAFQCGAVDYISKPFQFEEVQARVETHLKLYALQQALKLQNERLEESAADIIFRFELCPQPHMVYINPAVTAITGYSPEEHYRDPGLIRSTVHPDDRHVLETLFRGGIPDGSLITLRCVHRNGKIIWIEQRNRLAHDPEGRLIAVDGVARDITERKYLEEQLRQSQKMEAIGLLAGGVAHDFNNLLTVIIGYADLIMGDVSANAEMISQIKYAAERASSLAQQLLVFGRRQLVQARVLNVNAVVDSNVRLLRRLIGENIKLVTNLDPGLGSVRIDSGQLGQVLMNLVVNAKGAMPHGGTITIETQNITVDERFPAGALVGNLGPHVMLTVSDTGCGMDESIRHRIFEPFFTTKEAGKGTGLGLSTVYGIVQQNVGHIRVVSESGKGARFEVLLPLTQDHQEDLEHASSPIEEPTPSEEILVVEDNKEVRELIGAVLRNGGYQVLLASNGNEALHICGRHQGNIGLSSRL